AIRPTRPPRSGARTRSSIDSKPCDVRRHLQSATRRSTREAPDRCNYRPTVVNPVLSPHTHDVDAPDPGGPFHVKRALTPADGSTAAGLRWRSLEKRRTNPGSSSDLAGASAAKIARRQVQPKCASLSPRRDQFPRKIVFQINPLTHKSLHSERLK